MPHSETEIADEKEAKKAADAMSDAFAIIQEIAIANDYCPACFSTALAHAILMMDEQDALTHIEEMKGVGVDFIGKTKGTA